MCVQPAVREAVRSCLELNSCELNLLFRAKTKDCGFICLIFHYTSHFRRLNESLSCIKFVFHALFHVVVTQFPEKVFSVSLYR